MGRLVAIAGGQLESTTKINEYIISLTKKANPRFLFIGTASCDAEGYIENIRLYFEEKGCEVKDLSLTKNQYTEEQIDTLLNWADIIYVGGGDTVSMMNIWKKYSVDQKLITIYNKDQAVLCGLSAGAICWFDGGHSDSEAFSGKEDWKFTYAEEMLGLHNLAFCPHYDEDGRESFDLMLKDRPITGLAMDNDTAFVDVNGEISYMRTREDANAYYISYENGNMKKEPVLFT